MRRTLRVPDRRCLTILLAATLGWACGPGSPPRDTPPSDVGSAVADGPRPKLLLIGIDGIRLDVLADVATPALDALASGGRFVADARTTTPSVSGPAWSSMLTGVWPDKHGVWDNQFTEPRYGEYPDFLTRIERVRPEMRTVAIADWLPLVRSEESVPTIGEEVDVVHALDGYEVGWEEGDRRGTELAVEELGTGEPDALFLYLGNADETSHEHGSIGAEYRRAIEVADGQVGAVLEAVRSRPSYAAERWLVLVSTDHGRTEEGGHGGDSPEEMTIFVIAAELSGSGATPTPEAPGSSDRVTQIVDVAVTALTHLGVEPDPAWDLDGVSLSRIGPASR